MSFLWYQHGIIYQIYPRSFADSNNDGIGDLNGITGRLDYLADLGVDAIWLSPVYPSPDVDFGYDVSDYCAIDPKFGNLADFDRLLEEAHARGIRVILDLVLNHTSAQHPWFVESRSSRDNPKRDWYLWRDPAPGGRPPNNWQSMIGGSGWELDSTTGQFYFHMYYKEQPDVNWHHSAVRQAMLDVFRFWLDRGVDGFRLDVFNLYFKHPELASNPSSLGLPGYGFSRQRHIHDCDRPELIALLQEIRTLLDQYSTPGHERYVVGETFLSTAGKAAFYCGADRLHAAFNFELLESPWSPRRWMNIIQRWEHLLGTKAWPNYVLNNHDAIRSATRFRFLLGGEKFCAIPLGNSEDDAHLRGAAAVLLTLRGTPFIYYGEEIGMRNLSISSRADVLDPVGRKFWPLFKGRDGCRTPMQWTSAPNAGFSPPGVKTWLPVHPDAARRNVEAQRADPRSLYNWYQRLIALRRANLALTEGMFQPLTFGTRYILAYLRQTRDQTVLVALNFSRRKQRLVLGSHLARTSWELLLSTHRETLPVIRNSLLPLEPGEVMILEMR
jgi:alpha-glucosidase